VLASSLRHMPSMVANTVIENYRVEKA
jgi:phosphoribosylformylglycinamidine (FGAM) synthase PurS component